MDSPSCPKSCDNGVDMGLGPFHLLLVLDSVFLAIRVGISGALVMVVEYVSEIPAE